MLRSKAPVPDIAISGDDLENAFKGFASLHDLQVEVSIISFPHNQWSIELKILPMFPDHNTDRIFFSTGAIPISLVILNIFLRLEDIAKQKALGIKWEEIN